MDAGGYEIGEVAVHAFSNFQDAWTIEIDFFRKKQ
jgi:hypothetical protein